MGRCAVESPRTDTFAPRVISDDERGRLDFSPPTARVSRKFSSGLAVPLSERGGRSATAFYLSSLPSRNFSAAALRRSSRFPGLSPWEQRRKELLAPWSAPRGEVVKRYGATTGFRAVPGPPQDFRTRAVVSEEDGHTVSCFARGERRPHRRFL